MDSNGKFNLNHSDTSGELTEAIQEELESLTQKLAELSSVQPQTEEVRQAMNSVSTLKKVKREAAAQRRPAQSERKNRVFSAKRQTVWFEMP